MEHRTYYYARVSTKEQNLDRQLAAFRSLGASEREIITDKESGKDLDRKGYQALKSTILRSGDTLVIKSLDRLSRNKQDIHNELQFFKDNGIRLKVIDLPTTMMDLPEGQEWATFLLRSWEQSPSRNAPPSASAREKELKLHVQKASTWGVLPCKYLKTGTRSMLSGRMAKSQQKGRWS